MPEPQKLMLFAWCKQDRESLGKIPVVSGSLAKDGRRYSFLINVIISDICWLALDWQFLCPSPMYARAHETMFWNIDCCPFFFVFFFSLHNIFFSGHCKQLYSFTEDASNHSLFNADTMHMTLLLWVSFSHPTLTPRKIPCLFFCQPITSPQKNPTQTLDRELINHIKHQHSLFKNKLKH